MTNDPGAITVGPRSWSRREGGKTCGYLHVSELLGERPRRARGPIGDFNEPAGLKVYRTLRLAQRARVYQIAAHALGLAPPVLSTVVEVVILGQRRKRWGYFTAHAEKVGTIPSATLRRLCDRATHLGIPAFDDHEHNFGLYNGCWMLIDFAHPED